jgi:cell division transport system ATP-binding protein
MIINYKEVDIQREENTILYNVNFEVAESEFVYLTGVVGSGKSSLLKTIYGELDILSGTAEVLGYDMRRIKRRHIPALRKQLGIVFQDFRLLTDRNVRRNLDFVLRSTGWKSRTERANRIREVLETVGLADKQEAMPYELSGGEQQRVCIARAILNHPRLILADEATGNQDAASGIQTTQILYDLARQGTAVIMATHNNALIERFPGRVYECRNHQFLCHGPGPVPAFSSEAPTEEPALAPSERSTISSPTPPSTAPAAPLEAPAEAPSSPSSADDIPVATIANES